MTAFSNEDLAGFEITFRREILFYLHQLTNDGEQVSVMFNEGRDTILTVLLDVDEEEGVLTVDWGSNEATNQRFLASERNFFVATPQGIRNQFITGKPWKVTYKKRPAFAVRLPRKYVRLQRRDYFRLVLPMTQRPSCVLSMPNGASFNASVLDIGLGGMALEISASNIPCVVGDILKNVRVSFKSAGDLLANVNVRYVDKASRSARPKLRVGCQFDHLSPAQEHLLQKYITHVQREERARLGK